MKTLFVIFWTKGEKWTSPSDENFLAHINYIHKVHEEGKALLGGPFSDNSGSMTLLRVNTEAEAKEIIANSPGTKSGVAKGEEKKITLFYIAKELEGVV